MILALVPFDNTGNTNEEVRLGQRRVGANCGLHPLIHTSGLSESAQSVVAGSSGEKRGFGPQISSKVGNRVGYSFMHNKNGARLSA